MDEQVIKINISDRSYSLKVKSGDEDILKTAAEMINNKFKERKEKLGIQDKQDLLAMIAFDFAVNSIRSKTQGDELGEKMDHLENEISKVISPS